MDYIKLAQRTIAMLSSMVKNRECYTTRSREMKDNALKGLEQLRIHSVVGSTSDKCTKCPECGCDKYVHKDELGAGYRVCASCTQEWWTDVNYDS